MTPVKHAISGYLTPEYQDGLLQKLVERLSREGLKPGESVPARIAQMVNDYRSNRLRFANGTEMGEAA